MFTAETKHYRRLVNEARDCARGRGHRLVQFKRTTSTFNPKQQTGESRCRDCGCEVTVRTIYAANSIDISGEAISINCRRVA